MLSTGVSCRQNNLSLSRIEFVLKSKVEDYRNYDVFGWFDLPCGGLVGHTS